MHLIRQPDPHPAHENELAELLDRYASAVRLGAFAEAAERRRAIADHVANLRQLQDGEWVLEGVLFGAAFRSRGRLTPNQYRDPKRVAGFFRKLVEKTLAGVDDCVARMVGPRREN